MCLSSSLWPCWAANLSPRGWPEPGVTLLPHNVAFTREGPGPSTRSSSETARAGSGAASTSRTTATPWAPDRRSSATSCGAHTAQGVHGHAHGGDGARKARNAQRSALAGDLVARATASRSRPLACAASNRPLRSWRETPTQRWDPSSLRATSTGSPASGSCTPSASTASATSTRSLISKVEC